MSKTIDRFTQELKHDLNHYRKLKQQCLDDITEAIDKNDYDWLKRRRSALKTINSEIARTQTIIDNREKRSGHYMTKDARPEKRFRRYADGKSK